MHPDISGRLLAPVPGTSPPPLGRAGIGILPATAPAEAAGWLALADWFSFNPGANGQVNVKAMTSDDTMAEQVVQVSVTIRFSVDLLLYGHDYGGNTHSVWLQIICPFLPSLYPQLNVRFLHLQFMGMYSIGIIRM